MAAVGRERPRARHLLTRSGHRPLRAGTPARRPPGPRLPTPAGARREWHGVGAAPPAGGREPGSARRVLGPGLFRPAPARGALRRHDARRLVRGPSGVVLVAGRIAAPLARPTGCGEGGRHHHRIPLLQGRDRANTQRAARPHPRRALRCATARLHGRGGIGRGARPLRRVDLQSPPSPHPDPGLRPRSTRRPHGHAHRGRGQPDPPAPGPRGDGGRRRRGGSRDLPRLRQRCRAPGAVSSRARLRVPLRIRGVRSHPARGVGRWGPGRGGRHAGGPGGLRRGRPGWSRWGRSPPRRRRSGPSWSRTTCAPDSSNARHPGWRRSPGHAPPTPRSA